MPALSANIVNVGTEITVGQILNRNSAWLSEQLTNLGVEILTHISVPDDSDLMHFHFKNSLKWKNKSVSHVFITGGLGPTKDDFTRDVVAQLLGKKLVFNEESYKKILDRLNKLGREPKDSHKLSCYFPDGSQVLVNSIGTSDAFRALIDGTFIWVLPGPPRELQSLFTMYITPFISAQKVSSDQTLFRASYLGLPEAELAEKVELKLSNTNIKTGYRLKDPYVEIKLWHQNQVEQIYAINQLADELKQWHAFDFDVDWVTLIHNELNSMSLSELIVNDDLTNTYLLSRLTPLIESGIKIRSAINLNYEIKSEPNTLLLSIKQISENWVISCNYLDQSFAEEISTREFKLSDRYFKMTAAEYALRALYFFIKNLKA